MANVIEGKFSLLDVLRITKQEYNNRFDFKERDVLKQVIIKQIKTLNPDRPKEPTIRYTVETRSYPNYPPYLKKGKIVQRRIRHEYEIIMELDKLSLKTKTWKVRLGSGKKWIEKPSQSMIHSIYRENLSHWSKERIASHRAKRGLYENVGDYNARVLGINGDWCFRCSYVFHHFGHHFGRNYWGFTPAHIMNPDNIPFFPKHILRLIEFLMGRGILTKD